MELFSIPGVGAVIEKCIDGVDHILIQDRVKQNTPLEHGLIEIPAGKVRQYESVFDCLRREVMEETGLRIVEIDGEREAEIVEACDYRVISYTPFNSSQNLAGYYPIMVQTFICRAEGGLLTSSSESNNFRWIALDVLDSLLRTNEGIFYPMHVVTLRRYLSLKRSG